MKVISTIVLFAIISLSGTQKKLIIQNMPGAYNMLSQSIYDGKTETSNNTRKQLKIYTADFMMYAAVNPADSVSSFGIGAYTANKGTVVENVIYNASDSSSSATAASFTLRIEKTLKGYKQIIPEMAFGSQKIKLTEEYESVGINRTSLLDGAWEQTKAYAIKGGATENRISKQYKTYYAGHFIFGHTYTDEAHKLHTGMGYGTFTMAGKNKVIENVEASTYYEIRGKNFDIAIEMNGSDEFTQTITEANGDKGVELYRRLKK